MKVTALRPQLVRKLAPPLTLLEGYGYGSRYPLIVLQLPDLPLSPKHRQSLWTCLRNACPDLPVATPEPAADDWLAKLEWLLNAWHALQRAVGLPVFEPARIIAFDDADARCVVPSLKAASQVMASVIRDSLDFLAQQDAGHRAVLESRLRQSVHALYRFVPQASNVPRFVQAAFGEGIAFREFRGSIYQYGIACTARWLDSSYTDETPSIATRLSKSKVWCASTLREAGLPVPVHMVVADTNAAVAAANQIGYPVVVKPADLDGGVGVASGLSCEKEVRAAYEVARKFSANVLLEKHFEGRDYRITVFQGEAIWAIERVPAGVIGDGNQSIDDLIARVNADPRRGTGKQAPLQRLQLDEEASHLLAQQGWQASSVPPAGCFVRLRRVANVASGGTPIAAFDQMHPDNARLAVRAAEALRLDLAGIDLLIPDIAVSWRESGAAICEVNGQPNLGQTTAAHLYAQILNKLVASSGRVPTIVVVGAQNAVPWLQAVSAELAAAGLTVGVSGGGQVRIGDEVIHSGLFTPYAGGTMLAVSRQVQAMVISIEDDSVLRTGLPVDRCDAVILAGTYFSVSQEATPAQRAQLLAESLRCLLPACDGFVVSPAREGLKLQGLSEWTPAQWHEIDGEINSIAAGIVRMVRDRQKKQKK